MIKKSIRFLSIFALIQWFQPSPAAAQISRTQMVQSDVEKAIKSVIGSQLQESEYFVFAKVKLIEKTAAQTDEDKLETLPYSPVKVEKDFLEDILRRNQGQYPELAELTVTIVFDQRVPKEKADLLANVIRERFDFNGTDRVLDVKSLALVSEPVQQAEKLILEKTKLDSEKALLELQTQKEKFEMMKREEELKRKIAEFETEQKGKDEAAKEESKSDPAVAGATPPASAVSVAQEKPKGPLDYLQSFQLLIFATIAALVLMVVTFLSGNVVRKGLQPMAEAIGKIGDGVGKIAPAAAPAGAGGAAAAVPAPGARIDPASTEAAVIPPGQISASEDKSLEEFLDGVSEKLKILIEEKNFAFYRHFCDMIDAPAYRKMAAAIMLSVSEESAVELIKGISPEQIELLKDLLAKPGGVAEAQNIKKSALQEFFGRIAAEEFTGSPLVKMKNMTWITSMTARDMATFAVSLEPKTRTAFIACLTPARVNAIVAAAESADDKKQIMGVLRDLETITDKDIEETLKQISATYEKQQQKNATEARRRGVDAAKYMAQLAEQMSPEEKDLLMQEVRSDVELSKRIREHIIPFDAVTLLPRELLTEIFTPRTDLQIAQILFSTDDRVRAAVMTVLPEIRRENVVSELSLFEANKVYAKRYQKTSLQMQTEISRYLLGLYREGILDLDAKPEDNGNGGAEGGGSQNAA